MFDIPPGRWEGLDGLGDAALGELRPQAERAIVSATLYFVSVIKETLTGERHGITYLIGKHHDIAHVASAPGEAPAVLYGKLLQSVGASLPAWDGETLSAEVGVGLGQPPTGGVDPEKSYARRLELGGSDSRGVNIKPRPYLEPSAIKAEPRIEEILAEAMS